ncbi:ferritin-like domain-containing protein [Pseudanabaena sp. BC1403]|uniref:ferritin-like domain-containing protein n=1 Tax=Pseudanabaena sp. BC1403 TaxID=2043171 RepID=UPI000CD8A549|nr:ferritin-like domain-containing protein [Pseudanabaena sp. BC1403]
MNSRKLPSTSRRSLIKWGIYGLGALTIAVMPRAINAQTNSRGQTLTFNANDIGILNFALLLEELEAAFYAAVVSSGKITNSKEMEYMRYLGGQEAAHVTFLRSVLADQVLFATQDLSFNQSTLNNVLASRDSILNTAVTLEDVGVHAYNGAGPSLTNPVFLLAAGSIVSVEARHAAGVRALLGKPTTEPDSDRLVNDANLNSTLNPFKGRAYDELYTPKQIVAIVGSLNILNNPIGGSLVA